MFLFANYNICNIRHLTDFFPLSLWVIVFYYFVQSFFIEFQHCELHFARCWIFLYCHKYSWALFWVTINLLGYCLLFLLRFVRWGWRKCFRSIISHNWWRHQWAPCNALWVGRFLSLSGEKKGYNQPYIPARDRHL